MTHRSWRNRMRCSAPDQQTIAQRLFNAGIWATDRKGTIVADVPHVPNRIGTNYADRKYFRDTVDGNRPTISGPIMARVMKRSIIVFAVPLHDRNGDVIGMLCGGSLLGEPSFLDTITQNRYGKNGGFLLVSPTERLIITATDTRRILEKLPPPGAHAGIDRAMNGFRGNRNSDQRTRCRIADLDANILSTDCTSLRRCQRPTRSPRSPKCTGTSCSPPCCGPCCALASSGGC